MGVPVALRGEWSSDCLFPCLTSVAGGVVMFRLCSVTVLALTCFPCDPSTLRLNGYAIPPLVGRVLSVSVVGINVAGESGLSDSMTPGARLLDLLICAGTGKVLRSGATAVASTSLG